MKKKKFDFDDILIKPSVLSDIESRFTDISTDDENGMLPLIAAPMLDVLDASNYKEFSNRGIYAVIPRGHKFSAHESRYDKFLSYSLDDFVKEYIQTSYTNDIHRYVLIDIANGHQKRLIDIIKQAKEKYGEKLHLMVGNIANPKTYVELSLAGADYIRLGIGNGSGCTTTENGAVGYPMASLIAETYELSCTLKSPAKIIADGGVRKYSDIIKALALGADMVMIGGMFNKMLESAATTYKMNAFGNYKLSKNPKKDFAKGVPLYKKFRGMSTKSVQRELGATKLKTSEGVEKYNTVRWDLSGWKENFDHYLRTNMSYCGAKTIWDYIGKVEYIFISEKAYTRFNK